MVVKSEKLENFSLCFLVIMDEEAGNLRLISIFASV